MSQSRLAEAADVSRRWLSDFEAGKASAEIGLVFRVVQALDLALAVSSAPVPEFDLDEIIRAHRAQDTSHG
jgi:transcriptional regulator with XRE-family HTH domain